MRIAIDTTILEFDGRGISKATVALFNAVRQLYPNISLYLLQKGDLGCPVLTNKTSSIPEVCGNAVLYVDRNNDIEIQDALIKLEQSKETRDSFKKLGEAQAQKFSWENTAHQFIQALTKRKEI